MRLQGTQRGRVHRGGPVRAQDRGGEHHQLPQRNRYIRLELSPEIMYTHFDADAGDILIGDSHGNKFHVVVFANDGSLLGEFECPHVKVQ